MSRIDELQRLHEAATPGEWIVQGMGGIRMDGTRDGGYCAMRGPVKVARSPVGPGNGPEQQRDDMHAIVALHNSWPAIHRVLLAAREVAANEADDIDSRLRYVEVRPGRDEWNELVEALRALDGGKGAT